MYFHFILVLIRTNPSVMLLAFCYCCCRRGGGGGGRHCCRSLCFFFSTLLKTISTKNMHNAKSGS